MFRVNQLSRYKTLIKQSLITLLLSSAFVIASQAQSVSTDNVLYLKNGSQIKCKVLSIIPNENIKIKTFDGSIFVYSMNEVDRIEFADEKTSSDIAESSDSKLSEAGYKKSGFINITEMGGLFSLQRYAGGELGEGIGEISGIHIATMNGYQFNEHFTLGAIFGLRFYNKFTELQVLHVDFRYTILKKKVSPILYTNGGYTQELNGGFSSLDMEFGVGVKNYITSKIALIFTIGVSSRIYELDQVKSLNFFGIKGAVSF